jgi:hypothetical protein
MVNQSSSKHKQKSVFEKNRNKIKERYHLTLCVLGREWRCHNLTLSFFGTVAEYCF